ncbi:MAG: TolC family protein [Bacteriovorax sp.]|nr:TolC family protein [Bacteriovorax sp.]
MKFKQKVVATSLLLLSTSAQANEEFEQIWKTIADRSLSLKSSEEMVSASEKNKTRMARHWMPTIYATGSSYVTNDPGANMFGLLSERSIKQSDFAPDDLNHPGSNLFSKASIGINFPLYEGGMKNSIAKASEYQFEAKKLEKGTHERELFSEVAKSYFMFQSLEKYNQEISKIQKTLDSIIGRYQLGNKSNMLGYSGILGLRSLKNRILALTDESSAKQRAFLQSLEELKGEKIRLSKKEQDLYLADMNKYLSSTQNEYKGSQKVSALNQTARAATEMIGAEKSRNLPRIGVFTEGNAFNGSRKTATGYSAGLYLHWNLFSGSDTGASDEAIHNSHAAKYFAEANSQKEKIEFNALSEMESTLVKTISTLEESQKLLDEQTVVANSLFKNGMINALQLTEVLSRRVDLLKSKNEVELNLIETKSKKMQLTTNTLSF